MHDTATAKVRTAAIRYSRKDVIVFVGKEEVEKLGLVSGYAFQVLETTDCGGCSDGQFVDIGLRRGGKFCSCPQCGNILSVDEIFWVGSVGFRPATEEEEKDYNEIILNRVLNSKY